MAARLSVRAHRRTLRRAALRFLPSRFACAHTSPLSRVRQREGQGGLNARNGRGDAAASAGETGSHARGLCRLSPRRALPHRRVLQRLPACRARRPGWGCWRTNVIDMQCIMALLLLMSPWCHFLNRSDYNAGTGFTSLRATRRSTSGQMKRQPSRPAWRATRRSMPARKRSCCRQLGGATAWAPAAWALLPPGPAPRP